LLPKLMMFQLQRQHDANNVEEVPENTITLGQGKPLK